MQTQCGTPYEITQASQLSSLTLSSSRAPSSSWQGPCEIHLDLAGTQAADAGSGADQGSGGEESNSLDLFFAFMGADWAVEDALRVEYVTESGERVAVNMTEIMETANGTSAANSTTLTVPSKDVYISYTVGAPEHSWYVIIAWQDAASGAIGYPTMVSPRRHAMRKCLTVALSAEPNSTKGQCAD